jgi:lysophospholipase L1-like esterase
MLLNFIRLLVCFMIVLLVCQSEQGKVQADIDDARKVRIVWDAQPDAVMYELLITKQPPDHAEQSTLPEPILIRQDIYTAGVELDAAALDAELNSLWWQVRALNVEVQPISEFSQPQLLSEGEINPISPLPTAYLERFPFGKLYPAYSWIPVLNAASYEVQVLSAKPEIDQGSVALVRKYEVSGSGAFDCYDEAAYTEEGTYWWRVLAKNADNKPIGQWSPALSFQVQRQGVPIALFGDSVTHGGGAISNPPSDPAYDLTSYAGMPIKNLGRSGDTVAGMVDRFDHDVLPFSPPVLVILGGINDIRAGMSADEVIEHLTAIKSQCLSHGIVPVFVTLTPINPTGIKNAFDEETSPEWRSQWEQANQWIMEQEHHVDVTPMFSQPDGLMPTALATDGLHPDTVGKAMIGSAVGAYLKQNFPEHTNQAAQLQES